MKWKLTVSFAIVFSILGCMLFLGCENSSSEADKEVNSAKMVEKQKIYVATNGSDEAGDGSKEKPYATIAFAIDCANGAGTEIIISGGSYEPFEVNADKSGSEKQPLYIHAADGEKVVVAGAQGKFQSGEDGMKENPSIKITDASNITIEGLCVDGGTHGIFYESTPEAGEKALKNVSVINCEVYNVVGAHGICAYAGNDLAPVKNIKVQDCKVHDCLCGDSESLVLNGNIDGFEISGNVIYDNNNIGIDMIGFEGTAKHRKNTGFENLYDVDYVRNGKCFGNVVYNISAQGNPAYFEDGEYDLCADGIYVDGGQDIEIYKNFIFNCDIGLEVATEHSPDDNELFKVSGIEAHDNVIAGCEGWVGLCFGGYDRDLGFTEDCKFYNNTLVDNDTQVGVQRSKGNEIYDNIFVGDGEKIEKNSAIRKQDMDNVFRDNIWVDEPDGTLDIFDSLIEGKGATVEIDNYYIKQYNYIQAEKSEAKEAK